MSIEYSIIGQAGNQLYTQILASLCAKAYNLKIANVPTNILATFKPIETPESSNKNLVASEVSTTSKLDALKGRCFKDIETKMKLKRGFYQDEGLFNPYRDIIKNEILELPSFEKNTKDIILHLRLDGFNHNGYDSHIIHPEWYINILKNETFDKVYIVMATKGKSKIRKPTKTDKRDEYLSYFNEFDPIYVSEDERHDFNFIRSFDKIISSNSTFSWWAAFCSDASVIYLPNVWESRRAKLNKIGNVSKIVQDGYIYVNIDTMEKVKITTFH